MASSDLLRVGVVGLGSHFRETLLPSLIAQKIILTAFCDRDEEARAWIRARFPHALITEKVSDPAFWGQIDCVVCCSWPDVHEETLALAIQAGIHCFCEKPAARSAKALNRILENPIPSRMVIRVGHVFRCTEGGEQFINLLGNGDTQSLHVNYLGSKPRGPRWEMSSRKAFALTHLTHAIDLIIASVGYIEEINHVIWQTREDAETVSVALRTARCRSVSLMATNAASRFTCNGTAIKNDGSIVSLLNLKKVEVLDASRRILSSPEKDLGTQSENDGFYKELEAFFHQGIKLSKLVDAHHVLSFIEEIEGRG